MTARPFSPTRCSSFAQPFPTLKHFTLTSYVERIAFAPFSSLISHLLPVERTSEAEKGGTEGHMLPPTPILDL
jgi:hypothetical protein